MKKLKFFLTLGLFGGVSLLSACGGSDEEAAKKLADSLRADSTMKADLAKKAEDSIASAMTAQHISDSIAAAASLAGGDAGTKGTGSSGVVKTAGSGDASSTGGDAGTKGTGSSGIKGGGSGTSGTTSGIKGSGTDSKSGTETKSGIKGK